MSSQEVTAAGGPGSRTDYRELMHRVEEVVRSIARADERQPTVDRLAAAITATVGADLGLVGGRIYVHEPEDEVYRIWTTFGSAKPLPRGTAVRCDYAPVEQLHSQGSIYVEPDDPTLDPELERQLGTHGFAALMAGEEDDFLIAFDLAPDHERDRVLFSLGLLRHAIDSTIRHERMQDVLREARRIQASILPSRPPSFGRFDIAGRNTPLETVGGDFFDWIPISEKILGLAIADVSGHGLPAALQVRDIYMGLRMGLSRDLKIVRTVERLNQIINQSTLTGRFVSMFYGELEIDGTFIFVNAGHPPPFHLSAGGEVRFLEEGGVILGPIPHAAYTRGYRTVRPGDLVVYYTDGIVETACEHEGGIEEFGVERLVEVVRRHRDRSAAEIVDAVFESVESFCHGAEASDDRTVVVVRLPSE